ncbi:hypothetical protein [Pseudodesulfovibrio portus]|uniref:Uncharacterized protein n=1 Tax=Pseudodesulfovibrio portus TaxID=231439 RepID=A0ABN6RSF9_9BACT|nr:hypothetical protein [Pseudodesulfovibrio portus]BDQ34001.1 hypothetical protein JCM14722_15430 [Pseudodesulfovibrio portus]
MDENLETKLRELAEENGVDPDELIGLAEQAELPEGLDRVAETLLGDVALFGHALDNIKK